MKSTERTETSIRIENRFLQALLVVTVGILAFFLVDMLDRIDVKFVDLTDSIEILEDENKQRDSKLAELVLNIERRLVTLEAQQ